MTLNKRIRRIIKERTLRYVGIFILILLGSYTFVLASGLARNLSVLVNSFTEEHMQEDLSFRTNRPIPDQAALENASGAVIEEYLSYDAPLSETLTLRLLSATERLNIPALTEGQMFTGSDQILVDPAFAAANGYPIGSRIDIEGEYFTVTGFVSLPHYIYPVPNVYDILYSPETFGIGVVAREVIEGLEKENIESYYSVRFMDRTENINQQSLHLRGLLQAQEIFLSEWIDITSNRRANIIYASITGMRTMSVPVPVAMFLLSCLIIGIMLWRMVRRESVIIGTLYAQGYRRKELMAHYLAIPLLLALTGGVAGSLMALPSIGPSVMAMVTYYNIPVKAIEFSALNVLIAIGTPTLILGLSSYLVIRSELKRSPAELMKGSEQKTGINFLERAVKLERLKFNTKFKLREQLRSISRLLFLLIGVVSASVLMLFGFTIMSSMNQVFQGDHTDIYQFEYEYSFRELQYDPAPEGAEVFSGAIFYPENNERIEFWVTGIEDDSTGLILRDTRGNVLPNNQINITKPLAERLGLKAGDQISFIRKEDGKAYSFNIDAIADSYVEQFIFMPINQFNLLLGYPEHSYMGLFSTRELDIPANQLSGTKTLSDIPSAMDELLGPMISMIVLITIVSSVVALIIIYLVTSLIIEESKNTISLLKIFGYKRREVHSLILGSSTLVILAGFIIAVPIALASFGAAYGYLGNMINFVLPTVISPLSVLFCFAIIMLTYQFSKKLSAREVNAINMGNALKSGME
ncbi:MAG: FtsX-like permease family protein [Bacillota bacterium]|nr:FtsX-like permease family protein [Bacillota bacterium]